MQKNPVFEQPVTSALTRLTAANPKWLLVDVYMLDDGKHDSYYLSEEKNPAIISKETFQAVQIEKQHRSNVTKPEDGSKRKGKKYSSKK